MRLTIYLLVTVALFSSSLSQINVGNPIMLEQDKDFICHTIRELKNALIEEDLYKLSKMLNSNNLPEKNIPENLDFLDIQPINYCNSFISIWSFINVTKVE
uniref:Uncharacterized protein n=1 Tax=Ignavibacterium album TaxID=591197 RepID=A0A832G2A9_9BACT